MRSWSGSFNKIVVVNTRRGKHGCGGPIGFDDHWPHPMPSGTAGPGVCSDGLLAANCPVGDDTAPCCCYTSIENARADRYTATSNLGDCPDCPHKAPPFIQHSPAGWQTPPGS